MNCCESGRTLKGRPGIVEVDQAVCVRGVESDILPHVAIRSHLGGTIDQRSGAPVWQQTSGQAQ